MTIFARHLTVACTIVGLVATGALAAEHARRERMGHGKDLQQIEQQIRSGRSVTKRIQRDPRASADVKQKAAQLDQVLATREQTLNKLDAQYRAFLVQHKAEIDELEDLRKRALAIDQQLDQARTAILQVNRGDIDELKRGAQEARQLVDGLRSAYELDRRSRHQR